MYPFPVSFPDWLISRRHCNKDWQDKALVVREKINAAIQDMPEVEEITNLLAGTSSGLFGGAVEALRKVQPAVDLYRLFLGFTLASSKVDASKALPLTQFLISHGNTTTYEWRHGEPPEVVEESRPVLPVDLDNGNGEDQIDFGDFDLGNGSCDSSATSPNGDFVHVGHGDGEEAIEVLGDDSAISWDISVEADGTAADGAAPKVVEEQPSQGGAKVARGADALSLLHNPETRTQFFNELQELECFLSQWLTEMMLDGDALSASVLQQAPAEVQLQSRESVQSHLDVVKSCVSSLTAVRMQHLYQLHSSPKYVDRLVDTLQQKLYQADKNLQSREAVAARRQEALEEQRQLQPKLDLILAKTRQLQKQVGVVLAADVGRCRQGGRVVSVPRNKASVTHSR
ncbi:hypothetical protein HPB48_004345 [Haemaphysalis longicornis]|uniref:Uncharacterized protein n=1 Tax=Haemaphysalis longicornis TaxID=44386 RepID=A0A9J6FRJ2_HAELO|nr:hypothetical protein HPB48_004345 [Haemaphysalis longicornis]